MSIAALDTLLATGFGDRFEIELRGRSGAVTRLLRVSGQERAVNRDDVEAFLQYVFSPWRGNQDERRLLEQGISAAENQPVPAFGALLYDSGGNLWVRAFDNLDAVAFYDYSRLMPGITRPTITRPRRWNVIDPGGRYLGMVETPPHFTVYDIGADHVLGVWRDELDIQYVRQYPLMKPSN